MRWVAIEMEVRWHEVDGAVAVVLLGDEQGM